MQQRCNTTPHRETATQRLVSNCLPASSKRVPEVEQALHCRHTAAGTHFLDGAVPAGCRLRLQLLLPLRDGRMCVHADGHLVARRAGLREGCSRFSIGQRVCLATVQGAVASGDIRTQQEVNSCTVHATCLAVVKFAGPPQAVLHWPSGSPGSRRRSRLFVSRARDKQKQLVAIISTPTEERSSVACTSLTSHAFRSPTT